MLCIPRKGCGRRQLLLEGANSSSERSSSAEMLKCAAIVVVRVSYCVSLFAVEKMCGREVARVYRGANEDVAIEFGV